MKTIRLGKEIEQLLEESNDIYTALRVLFPDPPTTNTQKQLYWLTRIGIRDYLRDKHEKEKQMSESRMAKGQGKMETNEFGGKRESNKGRGRFDLIPYEALEELAIWYEQGADKYGDRNWEKGMSVKDCMNRMSRHSSKACNGWMDEGPFAHLVAVIWNAMAAITMIKRYPDKNDFYPERYKKHFHPKETYIDDYGMEKWPEPKLEESPPKTESNDRVIVLNLVFKNEDTYHAALTVLSQNIPNADFIIQLPKTDEKE